MTWCAWCGGPCNLSAPGLVELAWEDLPGRPTFVWHLECAGRDPALRLFMRPLPRPVTDEVLRGILARVAERTRERMRGGGP